MVDDAQSDGPDAATQAVIRVAGAVRLRSRKLRVEILDGPDRGEARELPGPVVTIGTAKTCDLPISDATVSRHHASLRVDGDDVRILDAGSKNGTVLDGVRVRDAYCRADSRIQIGNTVLGLRLLPDVIEIPLSHKDRFGALLGESPAMRQVFAIFERVAPTDTTVLIEGESGTGKELVAEALHDESTRSGGPFIVFDCSAVSANLIESELFGHVRGAFTGAVADRSGALEQADGGTLFLDEIGELPLDLQPKLLRALERLEFKRVGGNETKGTDVRIVAATNRSLATEVEAGRFREDLFYRLAVIHVTLPPLRERPDDIPLLARHFCRQFHRGRTDAPELSEKAIARLAAQTWPGNVRELRNAVLRALSLGVGTGGRETGPAPALGTPAALAVDLSVPLKDARDRIADAFEKEYLLAALRETGGNVSQAADLCGVNRKFIQRAMKRHDLRGDDQDR